MEFGATGASREMTGSGAALPGHALSSLSRGIVNRGQIQGQTVGTDAVSRTGDRSAQILAARHQISAGPSGAAGASIDTIIVTVTY
jgi:spore coat protein U-like protein